MNETINKLNLYDHFGYVLVGVFQIFLGFSLYCLITDIQFEKILPFFQIENTITIFLLSYIIGHIIQATSNIFSNWEKTQKDEKNDKYEFIINGARSFFNLSDDLDKKIVWQYCYLYSLSNDFTGQVSLFNSLYSLYRGIWLSSIITLICLIILLLGKSIFSFFNIHIFTDINCFLLVFYMIILVILIYIFNNRKKRFFGYLGDKTLITFDIISKKLIP